MDRRSSSLAHCGPSVKPRWLAPGAPPTGVRSLGAVPPLGPRSSSMTIMLFQPRREGSVSGYRRLRLLGNAQVLELIHARLPHKDIGATRQLLGSEAFGAVSCAGSPQFPRPSSARGQAASERATATKRAVALQRGQERHRVTLSDASVAFVGFATKAVSPVSRFDSD